MSTHKTPQDTQNDKGPIVKVDLHVHSHFSDSPKIIVLDKAQAKECYTSPEDVYQRARARGMDLVTITDHDTIRGALEIAHHGDHVFLSEEVSARFPDNGCVMHVLVYDITEAQHDEIQRLRYNIYDLASYLHQEDITHSLAHPLSSVNQRLKVEHLEQSLLLFKNLEIQNSTRDPMHYHAIERITQAATPEIIARWADKYDLTPARPRGGWGFTGGSDDHSGIAIARAYTSFEGPATVQGFKDALIERRTRTEGEFMTPISLSHNIYSGAVQYFMDRKNDQNQEGIYEQIFRVVTTGGASIGELGDFQQLMRSPLGRLLMAFQEIRHEVNLPTWDRMLLEGDKEAFHAEVSGLAQRIARRALEKTSKEFVDAASKLHIDKMIELLPSILQTVFLLAPYYIGYRYFYQDRRRAESLFAALGVGYEPQTAPSVAIFVDTLDDVSGVSLGLRQTIKELRQAGKKVHLLGLKTSTVKASAENMDNLETTLGVDSVVRFEPLAEFGLPGYADMNLGIPPTLEIMSWCVENQIDLFQASTPGPMGWAALAISRMMTTPIVGHYHTQVPEYAFRLLGDKTVASIVRGFVGWFYNSMDSVIVPSRATRETLIDMGLRPEKIHLIARGVDTQRFSPRRRNRKAWERYGLNGATKLLYVGRVSKEKNLDALVECFQTLREEGKNIEMGIVGDGPYRDKLKEQLQSTPGVIFTGYVGGEELAKLFASSDVFVFPSETDTFGNAVLEAQASSLPVVVTDQGGPSELIIPNRTGIMVPGDNSQALTDAVRRLVENETLRANMAEAARRHVADRSHSAAARELWSFYNKQISTSLDQRREATKYGV